MKQLQTRTCQNQSSTLRSDAIHSVKTFSKFILIPAFIGIVVGGGLGYSDTFGYRAAVSKIEANAAVLQTKLDGKILWQQQKLLEIDGELTECTRKSSKANTVEKCLSTANTEKAIAQKEVSTLEKQLSGTIQEIEQIQSNGKSIHVAIGVILAFLTMVTFALRDKRLDSFRTQNAGNKGEQA